MQLKAIVQVQEEKQLILQQYLNEKNVSGKPSYYPRSAI
jgi:hypothetical protein